jgi:ribosomal protein L29
MTQMQDLRTKSDAELVETVQAARKALKDERFKDGFSRKAAIIRNAKKDTARALTELNTRRNKGETK